MAESAKMYQRIWKKQGMAICKTNDKGLFYLTYKELIQEINDQRFKRRCSV